MNHFRCALMFFFNKATRAGVALGMAMCVSSRGVPRFGPEISQQLLERPRVDHRPEREDESPELLPSEVCDQTPADNIQSIPNSSYFQMD